MPAVGDLVVGVVEGQAPAIVGGGAQNDCAGEEFARWLVEPWRDKDDASACLKRGEVRDGEPGPIVDDERLRTVVVTLPRSAVTAGDVRGIGVGVKGRKVGPWSGHGAIGTNIRPVIA